MQVASAFFSSGHAIDLVVAVLILEAIAFIAFRRAHSPVNMMSAAAPGICLLFALRASLTGANWTWVALWLALSFPAHLADLWRRPP